jgi:membrane-associated protease RseP (regulator of RpoE activity)
MTLKKIALIIAPILGIGLLAGGIAYAQGAFDSPFDDLQEPGNEQTLSFFVGGTYLGVATEDITKENMSRYGLREVRGVGVTQVIKDSPAEKAGLKKDDVILRFDGESVTSVRKLTRLVSEVSADQTVRLTISRGGAEQELSATISKRDNMTNVLGPMIRDDVLRGVEQNWPRIDMGDGPVIFSMGNNRRLGASTQALTKQLADYFGVKDGGLLITSVNENSPAAKAGLKAGDVITTADGEKVNDAGDLTRAINKKEDGAVTLTVVHDHNTRTVTVTPEKRQERIIRPGTIGTQQITIPSVAIPAVPEMNIRIPRVVVPATPKIDVTVPNRLVRPGRARVVII